VKILLDNVNLNSLSGPNSFGRKLLLDLQNKGHIVGDDIEQPDVQLSFIVANQKKAKFALRLDGIYFNLSQDWKTLNAPIKNSFEAAEAIIYQSEFNKTLTETYFGSHQNSYVINNGTCFKNIEKIPRMSHSELDKYSEVWSCASSWRPHKRLKDNIDYFLQKAPETACMVVAGENPDYVIRHRRVMYVGQLSWEQCISLYKRSKVFIHLAFLDHCPNVVVDARASRCNIIVSSSGGTKEIAGPNAKIVKDVEWNFDPINLYSPPKLCYDDIITNNINVNIDITDVGNRYSKVLESI